MTRRSKLVPVVAAAAIATAGCGGSAASPRCSAPQSASPGGERGPSGRAARQRARHPDAGGGRHRHAGAVSPSGATHRYKGHDRHHRFDDPEQWAKHFDDPSRDEWQKPGAVLELLQLEPDSVVADIGSGTGYFAVRIARKVPQGRVWGVDIEPPMVRYLNERAREKDLDNLFSILGTPADPLLPEPVDVVLIVNTYHHISDRSDYFERLTDSLAPGARVAIVDFKKGETPVGPPEEMKIPPERVRSELREAGYTVEAEERERLPHQYVLVFGVPGPD